VLPARGGLTRHQRTNRPSDPADIQPNLVRLVTVHHDPVLGPRLAHRVAHVHDPRDRLHSTHDHGGHTLQLVHIRTTDLDLQRRLRAPDPARLQDRGLHPEDRLQPRSRLDHQLLLRELAFFGRHQLYEYLTLRHRPR